MYKPLQMLRKLPESFKFHNAKLLHKWTNEFVEYSEEVLEALNKETPIVALESTIYSHGLPSEKVAEVATEAEEIVRKNGTVPATITIFGGKVHIGLKGNDLENLAYNSRENLIKVSRRDIPYAISQKKSGGTTVASTAFLAHKAGIQIFATGGIGGVHKEGQDTLDISADLFELFRTPMTVVSAGVKSILDIGRTLEYLETLGVCVASFGESLDFPAFYTQESGFRAVCRVRSPKEAAELIDARDKLQLGSGILIGVPIPEDCSEAGGIADKCIEKALKEAKLEKITGKDITPYVLERVRENSNGASVQANIGLYLNNAKVASQIAVELHNLKNQKNSGETGSPRVLQASVGSLDKKEACFERPVVVGGSVLDILVKALEDVQMDGRTIDGKVESIAGGVGRNLADCMTRLNLNPFFISAVGAQEHSRALLSKMEHMDISGIKLVPKSRTAVCIIVIDKYGECLYVIGDMGIHNSITRDLIEEHKSMICKAPLIVMDGNIPTETMKYIFELCSDNNVPVLFEPTDLSIAHKPFVSSSLWGSAIAYATPNVNELRVMYNTILNKNFPISSGIKGHLNEILEEILHLGLPLLQASLHTLIVTLGSRGVLVISNTKSGSSFPIGSGNVEKGKSRATFYPALNTSKVVSVSGAGDCFASGMIGGILHGLKEDECVSLGQKAAILSLASHFAVPETITANSILCNEMDHPTSKPLILL